MAYNVKFLKGTAAQYTGLASKDVNTFYFTSDDKNLYLGEIKLSNGADLAAAILRIGQNETEIDAIQEQLKTLLGEEGEGTSIQDMIDEAIATIQAQIGTLSSLNTTAKDNLVNAINEVKASVSAGGVEAHVTITSDETTPGMAKSYTVKQGEETVGVIDIPKDMVVSSATVETDPEGQAPGTYIVLTIANATEDKIYVNVGKLVDIYTAEQGAAQVQLSIDQSRNVISATIVAGSITATELAANAVTTEKIADGNVTETKILDGAVSKTKLASDVQASLGKADSAVQSVTEGSANGTIAVNGSDVNVHGLGSAAYTNSDAYEAAGNVSSAIAGLAKEDAEVEGQYVSSVSQANGVITVTRKALPTKTVVTTGETNGTIKVDNEEVAVAGLKSAAYADASSFDAAGSATAAETNAKAYTDTALTWGTIA